MQKLLVPLLIFLSFFSHSVIVNAQGYAVKSINELLPEYKEKHQDMLEYLEKRTDLAYAQKYVLYQHKIKDLKETFRASRKAEYETKSVQLTIQNTCTGESGDVKDCGSKCLDAPASELYTQQDWVKVEGATKVASVNVTESTACLQMKAAGKASNTATMYAIFKYRPESILALTDKDTNKLFDSLVLLAPEYLR